METYENPTDEKSQDLTKEVAPFQILLPDVRVRP